MEIIIKIKIEDNGNVSSEILDKVKNNKPTMKQWIYTLFIFFIANYVIIYLGNRIFGDTKFTDFIINYVFNNGMLIFSLIFCEMVLCSIIVEAVKKIIK